MFPFIIIYSRRFNYQLSDVEIARALDQIKAILEDKTAEDIKITGNQLTFNSSFFGQRMNWNIMVTIDKGELTFDSGNGETILTYKIFMHRLFMVTAVMSIFMGMVSGKIWVGILCFTWLGLVNWLIGTIRHSLLITHIRDKIANKTI